MRIKNETIAKLTNEELADLGCYDAGICLYKGILKTRKAMYNRAVINENEVHFEHGAITFEFIKTLDGYAMRYKSSVQDGFKKDEDGYTTTCPILWGLDFIK